MELHFTKHALQRMDERSVSEDEVYQVFENSLMVLEKEATIIIGQTNKRRFLTLVMDMPQARLLTLWPSSRQERKVYQQRQQGGEL